MSLTEENRAIIVGEEMKKAQSTFEQALWMEKGGFWDGVAGRLYYAAFHAVCALLIKDKYTVKTHSGLNSRFGELYIKTGILPTEMADTFTLLQNMRAKSDYNCSFDATRDMIEPLVEPTKRLIDAVNDLINKK